MIKFFLELQPSTWIAIASLSVSIAALIISNRRYSFDTRLIGVKKLTEIRSLFFDYVRNIHEFQHNLDKWEEICKKCELYPEKNFIYYRESAESFLEFTNKYIKVLDLPVTKETAIAIEPITAYCDDLCKRMASINEFCRNSTEKCCNRKN